MTKFNSKYNLTKHLRQDINGTYLEVRNQNLVLSRSVFFNVIEYFLNTERDQSGLLLAITSHCVSFSWWSLSVSESGHIEALHGRDNELFDLLVKDLLSGDSLAEDGIKGI